jgi:hypothetical protein
LSTADLIATGALVVSLVSLFFSSRGHVIAKQAIELSKQEYGNKQKGIVGYLIDAFRWASHDEDHASFAISYTNKASEPNSFKDIYLEIEYFDAGKIFNKAKLPPLDGADPKGLVENYKELETPIFLNPKETKSGWITFKLPKANERRISVETYRVCSVSTSEELTVIESHLIKTLFKDEK